ncbi:MAG: serine/threonine protein kinase [Planctomycetes bacterium]|nr:serine/threonine protein kinase [Planctomycetota bacterium]
MKSEHPTEKSIFLDALDIESPSDRAAFIEAACQGNPELARSVSALFREHEREDNPIDRPIAPDGWMQLGNMDETESLPPSVGDSRHALGTMIGTYKLMEQIGEGGFGLVYVADQQEPIRRRVALKIIKPGMESREVLNRFEAERQAIALMDHPNIARVFDAGVTDTAQPYFVMELVRGVPLIAFCDSHKLDMSERLKLFVTICHAVQHAHQKGIIHRDLKPSNILVTIQDGQPLAKVIDFGVAKAIGQSLTVKTIYTRFASMVGTPAYMSPEQAEMSAVDVDTRSDIYSLGVLLYELLTGTTPFAPDRLQSVGFDELRRIIREEEPPRPSTRLSTLNNELASTVAVNRRLDPAILSSSMKRDLDWIVMKTLDKDRNRRYSTAGALEQDVSRFLMDQPVEARPPSTWYRFSKFARRNKVAISTALMVACALILGTAMSVWQARVAFRERDEKEVALQEASAAQVKANNARLELEEFIDRLNASNVLMASGRAHADAERWADAYEAYTEATTVQPKYFLVWLERGKFNAKLGRWTEAAADFAESVRIGSPVKQSQLSGVPQLLFYAGESTAYERLCEELSRTEEEDQFAVEIRGRLVGEMPPSTAAELAERVERMLSAARDGGGSRRREDNDGEDSGSRPPPAFARKRHRPLGMLYGANLYVAGWAHLQAGDYERAIGRLEESNEAKWFGCGIGHPLLAIAHHEMGSAEDALRSFEQSQAFLDRSLDDAVRRSKGSPSIPSVDWIEFLLNHRKASIIVKGHTPASDRRLRQMEDFAEAAIVD